MRIWSGTPVDFYGKKFVISNEVRWPLGSHLQVAWRNVLNRVKVVPYFRPNDVSLYLSSLNIVDLWSLSTTSASSGSTASQPLSSWTIISERTSASSRKPWRVFTASLCCAGRCLTGRRMIVQASSAGALRRDKCWQCCSAGGGEDGEEVHHEHGAAQVANWVLLWEFKWKFILVWIEWYYNELYVGIQLLFGEYDWVDWINSQLFVPISRKIWHFHVSIVR